MDETRPKIAIVAGELSQPRFLAMFEPLREAFDCVVHVLHHDLLLDRHGTGLKLRVYETIPDMPGYMRGLEDELAGVSLIIGLETSRLATFQAVRAARKHGIPMSVVVNEFHPFFYERFANIRAIQFDICNKAERFWVTSQAAESTLRLDSVPGESISRMSPVIDIARFTPSVAGRQKFRKYIGLQDDELVVLFHHDLEVWNRPDEPLRAMALLRQQLGPKLSKSIRIIFAGTGAATMDLKYLAYDLGLGPQALFLHQDPEPFLNDLYASVDVTLIPRAKITEFHEELPLRMLEAMACGAAPMVGAGSLAGELAEGSGLIFGADGPAAIAAQLAIVARERPTLEAMRERSAAFIKEKYARQVIGPRFIAEVKEVLATALRAGGRSLRPADVLARVKDELGRGAGREALMRAEEGLLLELSSGDRAELMRLKGDAHYSLGEIESAMGCYDDGLKADDRNFHCLRGLGFVAWQGHSNEEALTFFKKALALRDDDAETLLGVGLVYRRLGLTEEALFWLERCSVSFGLPAALVALAQTCAQLSRPRSGIEVLGRVIDAIGENHTLMMTLGQLYMADGRVAEGQAILQKALAGTPGEGAA